MTVDRAGATERRHPHPVGRRPGAGRPGHVLGRRLVRRARPPRRPRRRGRRPARAPADRDRRSTAWSGPCAAAPTASRWFPATTPTCASRWTRDAFAELVCEERTALGLVIGARRRRATPEASWAFCGWDPVLRSVLDGRAVYRPGDVTLRGARRRTARPRRSRSASGDRPDEAAHFLAEAGFLLLTDVFTDDGDGRGRRRPRARRRRRRSRRRHVVVGRDRRGRAVPVPHPRLRARARRRCGRCIDDAALPRGRRDPRRRPHARRPVRRALRRGDRRRGCSSGSSRSRASRACRGTRTATAAGTRCTARGSRSGSA